MGLGPKGYHTVPDAGACEGYYSIQLKPAVNHDRVTCVEGDLTGLTNPDKSLDVVICNEVLEHARLEMLFKPIRVVKRVFIGVISENTNALAAWLTDLGKVCSAIGLRLMKAWSSMAKPHANWIHMLFER